MNKEDGREKYLYLILMIVIVIFCVIIWSLADDFEDSLTLTRNMIIDFLGKIYKKMMYEGIWNFEEIFFTSLILSNLGKITSDFDFLKFLIFIMQGISLSTLLLIIKTILSSKLIKMFKNRTQEIIEDLTFPKFSFDFIKNKDYKEQLYFDYEELQDCYYTKSYKSVLLLSGSILESCLIDILIQNKLNSLTKYQQIFPNKKIKRIVKWNLIELIKVKFQDSPFQENIAIFLKDFRNIIHPDVQIRRKLNYQPNSNDAKLLMEALFNILKFLSSEN